MKKSPVTQTLLKAIKSRATEIKSVRCIQHTTALNCAAKEFGFTDWRQVIAGIRSPIRRERATPWVYPFDAFNEEPLIRNERLIDTYGKIYTPSAYRDRLMKDDPQGFAHFQTLTDQGWRHVANGANCLNALRYCDPYKFSHCLCDGIDTEGLSPRAIEWFYKTVQILSEEPREILSHWSDSLSRPALTGQGIIRTFMLCDRICTQLSPLRHTQSFAYREFVASGRLSQRVQAALRNGYLQYLGGALAFRRLPWSAISPFETLSGARIEFEGNDWVAGGLACIFVYKYGTVLDDNSAHKLDHVDRWWRSFTGDPDYFGYSVQIQFDSFCDREAVLEYAAYLRNAVTCFDPSLKSNVDAIDDLRGGGCSGLDFDLASVHAMLKRRQTSYDAIEKAVCSPGVSVPQNDFRTGADPLPTFIIQQGVAEEGLPGW